MECENTVKYTIYCDKNVTKLKHFCDECQAFCDALTKDYIWQKESFLLYPITHQSGLPCLCGSTSFGENVNDEWFIVFLLFELTKQFRDVVAHVSDDDGEFLLIQCADELPSWLKPETSENRVFIHQGNLHVIPQPSNPGELTVYPASMPSITEAYEMVVGYNNTIAADNIQKLIHQRISRYPERVVDDFHHAHCYIPAKVVYILQKKPHLVANAVQAFYERDPIDVSICSDLNKFKPTNRVMSLVRFTKHLYGQLHQANLLPNPKKKWKLPSSQSKLYKATYLGYKLTCGFEILLERSNITNDETKDMEPSGRLWEQYLSNLKKNDFFHDELEGSKKYMQLLEQAKHHFKNTFCSSSRVDEIGNMIEQLLTEADEHIEDIKSCQNLPPEDSDDWLTITPEELDRMMLNMWGEDYVDQNYKQGNIDNLSKIASSVKSFVDNVSSYEGAEVCLDNENITGDNDEIKFDPNTFMDCVEKLINPPKYPVNSGGCESDDYEDYDSSSDIDDEFVSCFRDGEVDSEMSHMMERMDMELKESTVHQSFDSPKNNKNTCNDIDAPLNIDINVVQNFLESFSSQGGLPGPVSSMLHSMGMNLPPNDGS